jgi:hypothetical protein
MKPDKIYLSLTLIVLVTVFSWATSCTHVANIANLDEVCFTGDVLPIFVNSCAISGCHDGGGGERMALNSYSSIMHNISPGNPEASKLYQVIVSKWGFNRMPPSQPLSMANRTKIRVWIEQGANETTCTDTTTAPPGGGTGTDYIARACFTRDILPVIVSRCASTGCHDAASHKEGYNYTTFANIRASVSPGNPASSRIYKAITTASGENKMPPSKSPQLTVAEKDSIRNWITYGALNENCGEKCDTVNTVTFSGSIWPVIQSACVGCHSGTSPSGNVLLANYNNVAAIAANGTLIASLKGTGVPKMPQGSSLSACRIRQFELWIKNGYTNN